MIEQPKRKDEATGLAAGASCHNVMHPAGVPFLVLSIIVVGGLPILYLYLEHN